MKKESTHSMSPNKRLLIILLIIGILLLVPYIGMQVSSEVNWTVYDFLVAGILLLITGLAVEFVLRKIGKKPYRILLIISILVAFILLFVELAVGIFGTPIAGS